MIIKIVAMTLAPQAIGKFVIGKDANFYLAYVVGAYLLSTLLILLHGLNITKDVAYLILGLMLMLGSSMSLKKYFFDVARKKNISERLVLIFALILTIVIIAYLFFRMYRFPVEAGDALAYWYGKAKHLYYWEPIENFPTIGYPNLSSGVWNLAFYIFGDNDLAGRLFVSSLVVFVLVGFYYVGFGEGASRYISLIYLTYYLMLFISEPMGGNFLHSTSGYVDFYLGATGWFLYVYILSQVLEADKLDVTHSARLYILLFMLGLIANIKSEGQIWAGMFYISLLLYVWRLWGIRKLRSVIFGSLGAFLVGFLFYRMLLAFNGVDFFSNTQKYTLPGLAEALDRMLIVASKILYNLRSDYEFIAPFAFYLILYRKSINLQLLAFLMLPFIGWILVLFVIYTTTSYDLNWHIATSLNRLLFQSYFLFPLAIALLNRVRLRNDDY